MTIRNIVPPFIFGTSHFIPPKITEYSWHQCETLMEPEIHQENIDDTDPIGLSELLQPDRSTSE